MNRRISPVNLLVVFVEALLISWALLFLAEEFGWHLVREAGGVVASLSTARAGHEGNLASANILSAARSEDKAANEALEKGLPPPPSSAWQGNEVNAARPPAGGAQR